MKILMLVNWIVRYCDEVPGDKQHPDYYVKGDGANYWFHRYFQDEHTVDVMDISSFPALEQFEMNTLHFYIKQGLQSIPKLKDYDLVVSHGIPSAVIVALWRKLTKAKSPKHIVFDIGCFNSAAESGKVMKILQYVSKSIDGIIYHTKCQKEYYEKHYPWLANKSEFIRFGTDLNFFDPSDLSISQDNNKYILCVGAARRDWDTLVEAYKTLNTDLELRILGNISPEYEGIPGVRQISHVPVREMINQIYNARLCVLPLKEYNFSYGQMTFLQQMALGKCVISAAVPSLEGYAENGKTAVFYQPENGESCAEAIRSVLDNPQLENSIINNAKEYLATECNEAGMAKQIEAFYKKILKTKE